MAGFLDLPAITVFLTNSTLDTMFYKQGSGGAHSNKSFQSTRHQTITYQHERKHI